ncbi:MAG: hypothetical protein ACQJCO_09500 [cyanobacterium endosymbiont of Rhopalodia sterrenbergii]
MNIEKQLEILANEAPEYGVSIEIMERAVNPVLKFFASQHKQTDYFVLHTSDHWIITTLNNRKHPQITKKVVYGFVNRQDARNFKTTLDTSSVSASIHIVSLPITHFFFQMFAIRQVDSIILMDKPNNKTQGIEIKREDIENMIQKQLQQATPNLPLRSQKTPPNLA